MKSTWLLLWSLRRHFFGGLLIELIIGSVVGQDLTPKDVRDSYFVILGPLLYAYLAVLLTRFPRRLYIVPFPVSVRQQAWILMAYVAILWLGGIAGATAGILYAVAAYRLPISVLGAFFLLVVHLLPVVIFLISMAQTKLLYHVWVAVCVLPMLSTAAEKAPSLGPAMAGLYSAWWPLILGMGVFDISIAPVMKAASDRANPLLDALFTPSQRTKTEVVSRPVSLALLAETGVNLSTLAILVAFAFLMALSAEESIAKGHYMNIGVIAVFLVAMTLFMPGVIRADYGRIRASGFGFGASIGLLLMRSTIVLFPASRFLGVRQGAMVRCERCGQWMFVWAPECARCASQQAGEKGQSSAEYRRPVWGSFLGSARLVPHGMVLFYMGMFIFLTYKLEINSHEACIYTNNLPATVSQPDFVREVRRVTTSQSMADWLQSLSADTAMKGRIPDTFKIDAGYLNDGLIIFTIVTPLSEKPGDLPKLLMERVREKLDAPKHVFQVGVDHFTSRQFLKFGPFDQQVHWSSIPEIDGER